MLEEKIKQVIGRCGEEISFWAGEQKQVCKAYLNPIPSNTAQYKMTESGKENRGKWLLITAEPSGMELKTGMIFQAGEDHFLLERTEMFSVYGKPVYLRGIAVRAEEEENE